MTRPTALLTALGALFLSLSSLPLALISPSLTQSLLTWGAGELLSRWSRRTERAGKRTARSKGLSNSLSPKPASSADSPSNAIERDVASTLRNQGSTSGVARGIAREAAKAHPGNFDAALRHAIRRAAV